MAEQTINPLSPVTRTSDGLKKKQAIEKARLKRKKEQSVHQPPKKKGIVDTFA